MPQLPMNGKGWAGSMAIGVSTASASSANRSLSSAHSASATSSMPSTLIRSSRKFADQLVPDALLLGHQPAGALVDGGQLLHRRQPVLALGGDAGIGQALQAGDADHVELVEIARRDREKAQALEQRVLGIAGFLQYALIERQPGQFPIEEVLWPNGNGLNGHGLMATLGDRRDRVNGLIDGRLFVAHRFLLRLRIRHILVLTRGR